MRYTPLGKVASFLGIDAQSAGSSARRMKTLLQLDLAGVVQTSYEIAGGPMNKAVTVVLA